MHGEAAGTKESLAAQAAEKFLLSHSLLGTLFFVVNKPIVHINRQFSSYLINVLRSDTYESALVNCIQ